MNNHQLMQRATEGLLLYMVTSWKYPDEVWTRSAMRPYVPSLGWIGCVRHFATRPDQDRPFTIEPWGLYDLTTTRPFERKLELRGDTA